MSIHEEYKKALLTGFDSSYDCFLYWKGRVALYSILKAIGISKGDEVLLQGFTCVVVPNAIKYLGAKPVYVDIEKPSLNAKLVDFQAKRSEKTKAVIVQNTFGLSSQVDEIAAWARGEGIYSIEDCTHGYGGNFNNQRNGSYCDAAFYSTQWNKPFSSGIGGFAISNHAVIKMHLLSFEEQLHAPSTTEILSLGLQLFIRKYFLNKATYWPLLKLYRMLSKRNILTGSSSGEEIEGLKMPKNYWKQMSNLQAKVGLKELRKLQEMETIRKKNARVYTNFLLENGKYHVSTDLFENHNFLRYPILVKSRDTFLEKAQDAKIQMGDWFLSPLHPVKGDLSAWEYSSGSCPNAEFIAHRIVNLPLLEDHQSICGFLKNNIDDLI